MTFTLFSDATSSGEAVNLQHRLRSLSTGLVGLRHVLHEQQLSADLPGLPHLQAEHQLAAGYGQQISAESTGPTSPPPPPQLTSPPFHPGTSRGSGMATTAVNNYLNQPQLGHNTNNSNNLNHGHVQG